MIYLLGLELLLMFLQVIMQLVSVEILQIVELLRTDQVLLLLVEQGYLHQMQVNFIMLLQMELEQLH